jgi:CHAT domain-containing protein
MDADIVLLSACNTASAFGESNSQGLSGMADSFFEAGAKSILASYWSVISESAVDITTRMFDDSNTGRSYAHKHRESILQLLEESNSFKTNPVYWAPFMVVGVN